MIHVALDASALVYICYVEVHEEDLDGHRIAIQVVTVCYCLLLDLYFVTYMRRYYHYA